MCHSQKLGSKIGSAGSDDKIDCQDPGSTGSHDTVTFSQDPKSSGSHDQAKFRIQDLHDLIAKKIKIQDPQDITMTQKFRIQDLQDQRPHYLKTEKKL